MTRVVITQPYVPAYRVPLFEAIDRQLFESGATLSVLTSQLKGNQRLRGDQSTGPWHEEIKSRQFPIARWQVQFRNLPLAARKADILVTELEALNALAWRDTLRRRKTVLWGHGKGFVNDTGRLSDFAESVLAGRADHVMTYTSAGRDFLLASGRVGPERVTAIGNSTDTMPLRKFTETARNSLVQRVDGPRALYVGGLDASKRIDFLLDAFDQASNIDPRFVLTVVGKGLEQDAVEARVANSPNLHWVPEARGEGLARLGADADALWVPGRVGLVAVDAIAMGLPVHTTHYPYHAPEIDLLQPGEVEFLADSPASFAAQSLELIDSSGGPRPLRADFPTIEQVARNFVDVLQKVG